MPNSKTIEQRQRELIHADIHEYVLTRRPLMYGLHPLLNELSLLLQKPLLFVVFTKPLDQIDKTEYSDSCGWEHSFSRPKELRERFNKKVIGFLENLDKNKNSWVLDTGKADIEVGEETRDVYALGIFYLHLVLEDGVATSMGSDERKNCGKELSAKSDFVELQPEDLSQVQTLFREITRRRDEKGTRSHKRRINTYLSACVDQSHSIFSSKENKDYNPDQIGAGLKIDADALVHFLKPILQGVDDIYRDLRGGTPGDYDLDTSVNSGSPVIWGRHRESLGEKTGIRPPNISFYLYLRAPKDSEHYYRITPLVTESMCKDHAGVFFRLLQAGTATRKELITYLLQLGVERPTPEMFETQAMLADTLKEATKLENYLGDTAFNSLAFPAFASSFAMFLRSRPISKCDRMAYGPDFLAEEGGNDTAFIIPTLVSGFPFIAISTKSRIPLGRGPDVYPNFDTFEYNRIFLQGVARHRAIRQLRAVVKKAYLTGLKDAIVRNLYSFNSENEVYSFSYRAPYNPREAGIAYEVVIAPGWDLRINRDFDLLAQAIPFGRVKLELLEAAPPVGTADGRTIRFVDHYLIISISQNPYFKHKLINDDGMFLKMKDINQVFEEAFTELDKIWTATATVFKYSNLSK